MWAGAKAYTPLALRVRWQHISPSGIRVKYGRSTAPAITLPDHSPVHNVECERPQVGRGIGQMRTLADSGEGVEKRISFCGGPL